MFCLLTPFARKVIGHWARAPPPLPPSRAASRTSFESLAAGRGVGPLNPGPSLPIFYSAPTLRLPTAPRGAAPAHSWHSDPLLPRPSPGPLRGEHFTLRVGGLGPPGARDPCAARRQGPRVGRVRAVRTRYLSVGEACEGRGTRRNSPGRQSEVSRNTRPLQLSSVLLPLRRRTSRKHAR